MLTRDADDESVTNAQFVSFLQQSGFRKRALSRHEKTKRLKRIVAILVLWAVVAGFAWVAIESAQAIDMF